MMWNRGGMGGLAAGLIVVTLAACGDESGPMPAGSDTKVPGQPRAAVGSVARTGMDAPVTVDGPEAGAPAAVSKVSYEEADRVYRSGDYGEAADLFEAYADRRPDNPWGRYMLGISAWKAGDHVRAEEALRQTLEVAPDHRKGLINLARVLLEEGNASDALEYAERVVALDPASVEAWRVLGNARSELGMVDDAVAAYRRALAMDHRDAWTMNNLGLLMIREGRYEEALPSLARATELRPDVSMFQNNLGLALERAGHPAEAVVAFDAALAADPEYDKARVSLERVQSRGIPGDAAPVDLASLARSFADDVTGWQEALEEPSRPVQVGAVPDSIG